jgi:hypothetical protein
MSSFSAIYLREGLYPKCRRPSKIFLWIFDYICFKMRYNYSGQRRLNYACYNAKPACEDLGLTVMTTSLSRNGGRLTALLPALAAARAAGNRQNEGVALNNLGMVYHAQGRWAEADGWAEFSELDSVVGKRLMKTGYLSNDQCPI